MNKFPLPPPDRRLEVKKNTYTKSHDDSNILKEEKTVLHKEESQKYNNLNLINMKQFL